MRYDRPCYFCVDLDSVPVHNCRFLDLSVVSTQIGVPVSPCLCHLLCSAACIQAVKSGFNQSTLCLELLGFSLKPSPQTAFVPLPARISGLFDLRPTEDDASRPAVHEVCECQR